MNLEDLKVYQMAMTLGEKGWGIVTQWNYFAKDTIGKQLVSALAIKFCAKRAENFIIEKV